MVVRVVAVNRQTDGKIIETIEHWAGATFQPRAADRLPAISNYLQLSPDQQPGTRSQQPFETYLYHIPASAVVSKPNYLVNLP